MLGLPDVARYFQRAGITALLYDPRSTGQSDGQPRNDIDPSKQVEDYSDALTFLCKIPSVDSKKVGFWGMSFAGTTALCAASLDKRAQFVIAACPLVSFEYKPGVLPSVLAKCMKDRESQVMGNGPFYLPMLTEKGENPFVFGMGIDKERYGKVVQAGKALGPNHVNRTTVQNYYKMVMWQPYSLWRHLGPTPVLFVVPEFDEISPSEHQLDQFSKLSGPKMAHIERGIGHSQLFEGEHLASLMKLQIAFISDALGGRVK